MKSEHGGLIGKVDSLEVENGTLKGQRETALASLSSGEFTSVEELAAHMKALLQG